MTSDRKAGGVDARCVTLGNQHGYRDKPGRPVGVPIWEFAAKSGAR
ncbi:hypothetical protein SAMN04488125_110122 [Methylorubrum salsuginis]|uniref:Uncharacterized protein n=1 Tax=Methylorubrum salsuginis TaxID=414703 RepID=A0A1I4FNH3_9HYPH|nr:hypothetical protein SAMN04488125_110122 [Methylorubrum salsuginis]